MLVKFLAVWGQNWEDRVLKACISWSLWRLAGLPQKILFRISAPRHCLDCFPQDGEKWEEGPCKLCECREAQVTCYEPSCPPCPVATLALVVKGQCCPDCTPGRSMSHFPVKKIQRYSHFSSNLFFIAHFWRFVCFLNFWQIILIINLCRICLTTTI